MADRYIGFLTTVFCGGGSLGLFLLERQPMLRRADRESHGHTCCVPNSARQDDAVYHYENDVMGLFITRYHFEHCYYSSLSESSYWPIRLRTASKPREQRSY